MFQRLGAISVAMAEVSVKLEMEEEYETAPAEVFCTEEEEEWCFVCKDGGDMILCDHKNCPKVYHRHCAVKNKSSVNNVEEHFECAWHSCFNCKNPSNFRCYVCPKSICNSCMDPECFLLFKGIYGFCDKCRKFALAIESIDIEDLSTQQVHFKEYYEILAKQEGFDLITLLSAKKLPILKNNDHDRNAVSKKNGNVGEDKVFVKLQKRKINYVDLSDNNDDDGVPETRYAAIIAENIRLIYLTKSLVLDLLKQPESFESKVQGTFVRVKSNLLVNGDCQSNSHQLVQVVGVKREDDLSGTVDVKLQLLNVPCDVSIDFLSNAQFYENECEILRQNIESGILMKPIFEEFEQKAKALHHDLTKHSIERELNLLKHLIDRANEKGRRRQYFEYLERKERLETESEVKMMLNTPPKVIAAEVSKVEPVVINTIRDEDKNRKITNTIMDEDKKRKKSRSLLKTRHGSTDSEDAYKIKKTRSLQKPHHGSIDSEDAYKIKGSFAYVPVNNKLQGIKDTLKNNKGCVLEDDVNQELNSHPIELQANKTTSEKISPKNSISSFDDEALGRTLDVLIKPTTVFKHSIVSVPSKVIDHFQKGFILALKEIPISNYKELMIPLANGFFATIRNLNIDYTRLYSQVKDYIQTSSRLSHIDNSEKNASVQELTIKYESRKLCYEKSYEAFNEISKSLNADSELSVNRSEHVSRLSNMVEKSAEMEKLKKEMLQALDELDDRRKKWLEEEKAKEDYMTAKAALDCKFMM